jgi:hypothetical protein
LISRWVMEPDRVPRKREAEHLVDLIMSGLRQPGHAARRSRGRTASSLKDRQSR